MTPMVLQSMRWSEVPEVEDLRPMGERDAAVLADLHEVLRKHGCVDRFGIFLIHKHFEVAPDEIVVEYTDKERREQVTVVEAARANEEPKQGTVIETAWKFDTKSPTAVTVCVLRCRYLGGHKTVHVREGR